MSQAGGQGAERHQRLTLSGPRLDPAHRVDQALDEVDSEGEPGVGPVAEDGGGDRERAPRRGCPAGGEVDAVLVPGPEAAGPLPRLGHRPQCCLLLPHLADEADGALEQDPPGVRGAAFVEQDLVRDELVLLAGLEQLGQLLIGEPVEDRQGAKVLEAHQIVAR